jgi:hypothetical protein
LTELCRNDYTRPLDLTHWPKAFVSVFPRQSAVNIHRDKLLERVRFSLHRTTRKNTNGYYAITQFLSLEARFSSEYLEFQFLHQRSQVETPLRSSNG